MGMYTEFYFTAELKPETPADVIRTLDGMVKGHSIVRPDHPLFKTNR